MINKNVFIMYDYETGSRNPATTQPVQIAAIAIDPRNLTIIEDSEFESLIRPEFDNDKCIELKIDPIEQQALDVNGKTVEMLKDAPGVKSVWESFCKYAMNFNPSGKKWDCPILVGFNNLGFDDVITKRLAKEFGPYDASRDACPLFHPVWKIDVIQMLFPWFESNYDIKSMSMDSLREYFGMDKDGAHDALVDVKQQAQIFCQLMKITRKFTKVVTWNK